MLTVFVRVGALFVRGFRFVRRPFGISASHPGSRFDHRSPFAAVVIRALLAAGFGRSGNQLPELARLDSVLAGRVLLSVAAVGWFDPSNLAARCLSRSLAIAVYLSIHSLRSLHPQLNPILIDH